MSSRALDTCHNLANTRPVVQIAVTITEVTDSADALGSNYNLSGENLTFEVEPVEIL
jgi:FKBP-type peptidyl-prolyl cis-trans isomerase 2